MAIVGMVATCGDIVSVLPKKQLTPTQIDGFLAQQLNRAGFHDQD